MLAKNGGVIHKQKKIIITLNTNNTLNFIHTSIMKVSYWDANTKGNHLKKSKSYASMHT